ncbi:hypothetical protein SLE2022_317920 [Rubroshorea leprosula]
MSNQILPKKIGSKETNPNLLPFVVEIAAVRHQSPTTICLITTIISISRIWTVLEISVNVSISSGYQPVTMATTSSAHRTTPEPPPTTITRRILFAIVI